MADVFNNNVLQSLNIEFIKFVNQRDEWWLYYITINDDLW